MSSLKAGFRHRLDGRWDAARQLTDRIRRDPARAASQLHWTTLLLAGVFLAWADRHQWFDADQWAFLVGRRIGGGSGVKDVLAAHNEHWSSFPILMYRGLFTIFGVRTYAPYLAVVIVAHLILAHLIWRFLRRMGVQPFLAVGAVGLFAVLGIGWENLTSAFQYQFFGPLLFCFGALLVLGDGATPTRRRQWVAALLLVLGLPFSGLELVSLLVVGAYAVVRWGPRVVLVVVGPAAGTYTIWYLAERKHIAYSARQPLSTALQAAPAFVWRGLVDASDHALGLAGIGAAALVLLALFAFRGAGHTPGLWPDAIIVAAGALLFLGLTDLGRSGLGVGVAGAPRYSYVVIAFLLPAAVLAVDAALGHGPVRVPAAIMLGLVLLTVQLATYNQFATTYGGIAQEQKRRIVATAALVRMGARTIERRPVPDRIPDLTVSDVARLDRAGDLPGNIHLTSTDLLTAAVWVQLTVSGRTPPPGSAPDLVRTNDAMTASVAPGCVRVTGAGNAPSVLLHFDAPGRLELQAAEDLSMSTALEGNRAGGGSRTFTLLGDQTEWLRLATSADVVVTLPLDRSVVLCGLGTAR